MHNCDCIKHAPQNISYWMYHRHIMLMVFPQTIKKCLISTGNLDLTLQLNSFKSLLLYLIQSLFIDSVNRFLATVQVILYFASVIDVLFPRPFSRPFSAFVHGLLKSKLAHRRESSERPPGMHQRALIIDIFL